MDVDGRPILNHICCHQPYPLVDEVVVGWRARSCMAEEERIVVLQVAASLACSEIHSDCLHADLKTERPMV